MSHFAEMEWNSKWDWENFLGFGPKAIENPKKLQLADWTIVDDGQIDAGSFNLSAGGGNSGASDSDGGHVSSAKSSISASTDSSTKDGMQNPNFSLITFQGFSGNFSKKMEMEGADVSGTSPLLDASIGSVEPLIGLKLGKRTYFENSGAGGNVKAAPLPVMPTPSATSLKKTKSLGQNLSIPRCVVEDAMLIFQQLKNITESIEFVTAIPNAQRLLLEALNGDFANSVAGSIPCLNLTKRSAVVEEDCLIIMHDVGSHLRKLSSLIRQGSHRHFMTKQQEQSHTELKRNPANTTWDSTSNSKFTLTKGGYPLKSNGDGGTDEQMHMPGINLPHVIDMHGTAANDFLVSKSSIPTVLSPGSKGPLMSSHLDAAPEYRCALSLLSSNSWGSCGPESMPVNNQMHEVATRVDQPVMHATPEGVPLSSSQFWLTGHQPTQHHVATNVGIFINKHRLKPRCAIMHPVCYSDCRVRWIVKPHVAVMMRCSLIQIKERVYFVDLIYTCSWANQFGTSWADGFSKNFWGLPLHKPCYLLLSVLGSSGEEEDKHVASDSVSCYGGESEKEGCNREEEEMKRVEDKLVASEL
ncbi:UNVERIFIED_CONTAM: Squamosa promoter-binding-like protein 12 [Sesamum latifolium]|uniref:Squamosa promoter-binding-like protein 12 n=1 Tax=Sesamum latifolium TaxID=2727402 RepID=A0AAW2UWY0_9LAMI